MATVFLPSLLRQLAGGTDSVKVSGSTLRQVLEELDERFPGMRERLCDEAGIRPNIAVWIDGETTREGLIARVNEASEIHFLPAISGG